MFSRTMFSAFFRLFRISISVLILTALTFVFLRSTGLSTNYEALDHPLLKKEFFLIAKGGGSLGEANTREFFKNTQKLSSDIFLKVDIMLTKDAHLILFNSENLADLTNGTGFTQTNSLQDFKKIHYKNNQPILSLEDYFIEFPLANTVINIAESDPARIFGLLEIVNKYNKSKQIIFMSNFSEPLKYLRRESPRSLFSLAKTDLVQLNLLSSIFLEPLARIKSDFVISPLFLLKKKPSLDERILQEIKRRKIKLILELDSEVPFWLKNKYDGIMTTRPEKFL